MKKVTTIIFLSMLMFVLKTSAQISFVGFDLPICSSPMTNVYTYNNVYIPGTPNGAWNGYYIYRNGIQVYVNGGNTFNGLNCENLTFINDSIGFMIIHPISWNIVDIYKTSDSGVTWTYLGYKSPFNYLGFYVINEHFAYLIAKDAIINSKIDVIKFSDIQSQSTIITDTTIVNDIYKTDTILGNSLCNIDSLKIFVKNNTDTITYHINFHIMPLGINNNNEIESTFTISPNPNNGEFTINFNNNKDAAIKIINVLGQVMYQSLIKQLSNVTIDISTYPRGVYFVEVGNVRKKLVKK